ncbi:3525_t:CDS:2, partial [Entrophospora sp. SA101]
ICPKRLSSRELSEELENRGVDYGKQNKRQKLIEVLDEELRHETLASIEGSHLRNPSMSNKEEEISNSHILEQAEISREEEVGTIIGQKQSYEKDLPSISLGKIRTISMEVDDNLVFNDETNIATFSQKSTELIRWK